MREGTSHWWEIRGSVESENVEKSNDCSVGLLVKGSYCRLRSHAVGSDRKSEIVDASGRNEFPAGCLHFPLEMGWAQSPRRGTEQSRGLDTCWMVFQAWVKTQNNMSQDMLGGLCLPVGLGDLNVPN